MRQEPGVVFVAALVGSPEYGGIGDGIIDDRDAVFPHLLLWMDDDGNGVSSPDELTSAWDGGVRWLSLDARECHRTDPTGTRYAYRAKVGLEREHGTIVQRFAYAVIFFVW